MKYDKLPSNLTLKFDSNDLDILELGILNYHLHALLNQVAIALLTSEDETRIRRGEPKLLEIIPQTINREDALIRARITGLREGSVELDLQTVIAAVANTPGAIPILQNLAANAVWVIGAYVVRVPGAKILRRKTGFDKEHRVSSLSARKSLGAKAEKFVKQLAESSNGGYLHLRSGDEELEIEFNPPQKVANQKDEPR